MNIVYQLAREVKHFFAPHFCTFCRIFFKENNILCAECLALLRPIVAHHLKVTQKLTVPVFALSSYDEPLKSLILAKASSNLLASKQLVLLMWRHSILKHQSFDAVVPIPLHWTRKAYRGYNQAAVMANQLSRLSGKPVVHILKRIKRTPLLSSLSLAQRPEIVKDAFVLHNDYQRYRGKNLLLVDDVMTTGATLIAACKQLSKCKPASIKIAVAARVI